MQQLRRLFQKRPSRPLEAFTIEFDDGKSAQAVRTARNEDAASVVSALRLHEARPTLVVMGGAGKMDPESARTTRSSIEDGLSRFAEEHHVAVIDGGTTAGVMGLLGYARQRRGYRFPLIGVAPDARVEYPGHNPPTRQAVLDANHSHFVLVDGDDFGAESDLLAALGWTLAGRGSAPILGIVINGGAIVKNEAHARATSSTRFPLLILEGSGRFADELAAAVRARTSDDPQIRDILRRGTVYVLPITTPAESLRKWLENALVK